MTALARRSPGVAAATLVLIATASLSCGTSPSSESRDRRHDDPVAVNVCTSSTSATQALSVYAQDNGLFRRYGLDVSFTPAANGWQAAAALASGSVQLCTMAGVSAANAVLAGATLVVVGSLQDTHTFAFVVSKGVRSPADLKGKAVAASAPGTAPSRAPCESFLAELIEPNPTLPRRCSEPVMAAALLPSRLLVHLQHVPRVIERHAP